MAVNTLRPPTSNDPDHSKENGTTRWSRKNRLIALATAAATALGIAGYAGTRLFGNDSDPSAKPVASGSKNPGPEATNNETPGPVATSNPEVSPTAIPSVSPTEQLDAAGRQKALFERAGMPVETISYDYLSKFEATDAAEVVGDINEQGKYPGIYEAFNDVQNAASRIDLNDIATTQETLQTVRNATFVTVENDQLVEKPASEFFSTTPLGRPQSIEQMEATAKFSEIPEDKKAGFFAALLAGAGNTGMLPAVEAALLNDQKLAQWYGENPVTDESQRKQSTISPLTVAEAGLISHGGNPDAAERVVTSVINKTENPSAAFPEVDYNSPNNKILSVSQTKVESADKTEKAAMLRVIVLVNTVGNPDPTLASYVLVPDPNPENKGKFFVAQAASRTLSGDF